MWRLCGAQVYMGLEGAAWCKQEAIHSFYMQFIVWSAGCNNKEWKTHRGYFMLGFENTFVNKHIYYVRQRACHCCCCCFKAPVIVLMSKFLPGSLVSNNLPYFFGGFKLSGFLLPLHVIPDCLHDVALQGPHHLLQDSRWPRLYVLGLSYCTAHYWKALNVSNAAAEVWPKKGSIYSNCLFDMWNCFKYIKWAIYLSGFQSPSCEKNVWLSCLCSLVINLFFWEWGSF